MYNQTINQYDLATLMDLNSVELNSYLFTISLEKCNRSYNVIDNVSDNLSTKICVASTTKEVDVKVFNMMKKIDKPRTLIKHISCNCKCKFYSTTWNSNPKWNDDKYQCECKNYRMCKKDYSWIPSTCICENIRYLKSIVDESVIVCDAIVNAVESVLINVTNTLSINMTNTK